MDDLTEGAGRIQETVVRQIDNLTPKPAFQAAGHASSHTYSSADRTVAHLAKTLDGQVDEVAEGVSKTTVIKSGEHFDEAGQLKPNVIYEAGEHKYLYETDDIRRIERVHTDELQMKEHDGRLLHNPKTPDKLPGDHAGHLIADQFGGSPELDNLISQAKDVNMVDYRSVERDWADALNATPPKKVEVDIKINYEGTSRRPSSFEVKYWIDGEEFNKIIENINKKG